jgi:hypothetical protein
MQIKFESPVYGVCGERVKLRVCSLQSAVCSLQYAEQSFPLTVSRSRLLLVGPSKSVTARRSFQRDRITARVAGSVRKACLSPL